MWHGFCVLTGPEQSGSMWTRSPPKTFSTSCSRSGPRSRKRLLAAEAGLNGFSTPQRRKACTQVTIRRVGRGISPSYCPGVDHPANEVPFPRRLTACRRINRYLPQDKSRPGIAEFRSLHRLSSFTGQGQNEKILAQIDPKTHGQVTPHTFHISQSPTSCSRLGRRAVSAP